MSDQHKPAEPPDAGGSANTEQTVEQFLAEADTQLLEVDAVATETPALGTESPSGGPPAPASSPAPPKGQATQPVYLDVPLLPLRSDVVFPQMIVPLVVGRDRGIKLVDDVEDDRTSVGLVTQKTGDVDDPTLSDLYPTLCVARVLKSLKFPDGTTRIVAHGLQRARLVDITAEQPYLRGRVETFDDVVEPGVETDALTHNLVNQFNRIMELTQIPEELQVAVMNTAEPGHVADLLASGLPFSVEEKQGLLAEPDVRHRTKKLIVLLRRQLEVLELSTKIQNQVGDAIGKVQREHFLQEQLKAIRHELGESGEENEEIDQLWRRLARAKLPKDARAQADRELGRLRQIHPASAEYSVVRTYLDWLIELPWSRSTKDRLNLSRAARVLNADHHGLEKLKERIIEYLSVRKLKNDMKGPILCFVGPPGTGKTSLGRSIARAMGRQFVRMSLGGVRDEAEIRGHRRTYVAALPGRIIQGIHKARTNNPVFILDEVDKLGADFRGDPSSALLEVLDPEQNYTFRDHYLDVEFDLSRVMFIATANTLTTVPSALADRLEVLELPGYSEEEKMAIAQKHLIPKQLLEHGLPHDAVRFNEAVLSEIIGQYTREAGLRNLERQIATLCRKVARRYAEGKRAPVALHSDLLAELLGPPKHFPELADRTGVPGVATGLAWTPAGGEVLFVETTAMPGKRGLTLTGSLGDVMKESAQAALSYIRSHGKEHQVPPGFFDKRDLHIHVPSGAIPKDGPSAGIAILASVMSLLHKQPLPPELAMTGEITLAGRVLPVGGVREKLLAARRAGIRRVILPKHNEKDTVELPPEVRDDLELTYVESIDQAARVFFEPIPAVLHRAAASRAPQASPDRRRSAVMPQA
jgi:ATP-dependent Lon protease